jgi:hypothetical protein
MKVLKRLHDCCVCKVAGTAAALAVLLLWCDKQTLAVV